MKRSSIWLLITMVTISITAVVAFAGNVHLKPPKSNPTFTDLGLSLAASGALAGLGNGDVLVILSASGDVTATCTNPAGATQPAGQNPAPITVTGTEPIPETELKNGTTPFDVATDEPVSPIPGAPECPNPNWTEDITNLAFTSAIITVQQSSGNTVLTVTCTFDPSTSDGPVPSADVDCTVS